jgi:hypothetical protein
MSAMPRVNSISRCALMLLIVAQTTATAADLKHPFRLEANGKPIDMTQGNAAPFVVDFDGDGQVDLLLGQRGDCKLRIYRNLGDNIEPRLGPSAWFKAGGEEASLPGG